MGFADKLWKITPPFLKQTIRQEDSDSWIWLIAIGKMFDDAKGKVFLLRRQALVPTATGLALDQHGPDRKLSRSPGEDDETFRKRLINYRDYYLKSGTRRGIVNALWTMNYLDAEFYPLFKEKYQTNPDPELVGLWSQFIIRIPITGRKFLAQDLATLRLAIDATRPPESKLYAFNLKMSAKKTVSPVYLLQPTEIIRTSNPIPPYLIRMDGSRMMDGTWRMDSARSKLTITQTL